MLLVTELGKGNRMEETITLSYPESKLKSAVHFQMKKRNTRVHSCAIELGSQLRGDICFLSFSSKAWQTLRFYEVTYTLTYKGTEVKPEREVLRSLYIKGSLRNSCYRGFPVGIK